MRVCTHCMGNGYRIVQVGDDYVKDPCDLCEGMGEELHPDVEAQLNAIEPKDDPVPEPEHNPKALL